jgi:hypothetical protein
MPPKRYSLGWLASARPDPNRTARPDPNRTARAAELTSLLPVDHYLAYHDEQIALREAA